MNSLRDQNGLGPAIAKLLDSSTPIDVLPSRSVLENARQNLIRKLPNEGIGLGRTLEHLSEDVKPALNGSSLTQNYYGFVTGGSTPAASIADNLVTLYDQNVQVHLPNETIATDVEDAALGLLCDLLDLDHSLWPHRLFTTGATSSNIVGLACGREAVIAKRSTGSSPSNIGELGLFKAMTQAGIHDIQILTSAPHSSLSKAASIIGLGRSSIKTVGRAGAPHLMDLDLLEAALRTPDVASIVAISCAEVNTGNFATLGLAHMQAIRNLCDQYGAWIHVDGAFGIFARLLDSESDADVVAGTAGLELADSITGDCHKLLNVPYDCGFILSRDRKLAEDVFQNPNAAYLSAGGTSDIASPLNIGLENSRRFRALPAYATLLAYGRNGYKDMIQRQVKLARGIAKFIAEDSHFELLPERSAANDGKQNDNHYDIYMIVLFRAKDAVLNAGLVDLIKDTRKIYVSGTTWNGAPACRFAISNWQVDPEVDLQLISSVLTTIARDWHHQ